MSSVSSSGRFETFVQFSKDEPRKFFKLVRVVFDWITESQAFFGYEGTCDFSLVSNGLKNVGSTFNIPDFFDDALKLHDCIESVEIVGTRKLVVTALDLTSDPNSLLQLAHHIDYIDLGTLFPPLQVIGYSHAYGYEFKQGI